MKFKATQNFFSEATRSQYVGGLTYTLRPGATVLAKEIPGWLEAGLITVDFDDAPLATAEGKGKVE